MTPVVDQIGMNKQKLIRHSVKAVIVRNERVLLVGYDFDDRKPLFYKMPGGGIKPDEELEESLQHILRQNINAEVRVGQLLFVVEGIAELCDRQHYPTLYYDYYFQCTLQSQCEPEQTPMLVNEQQNIYWLPLSELSHVPLWPKIGRSIQVIFANNLPASDPTTAD